MSNVDLDKVIEIIFVMEDGSKVAATKDSAVKEITGFILKGLGWGGVLEKL